MTTGGVYLADLGLVCALGTDRAAISTGLFRSDAPGGLSRTDRYSPGRRLHLGLVPGEWSPSADVPLAMRSRNNALLYAALGQIQSSLDRCRSALSPSRIGVIIGSSTSGIAEGEMAIAALIDSGQFPDEFHYAQQDLASPAQFVAWRSGASGPAMTISTACSSSAKALASGARWLRAGICDAVIAGGADSLCAFTVAGFSALESVSSERCNPSSRNRCGINIGEGAGLFLMTRSPAPIRLSGCGESSDAHHISAPEPQGRGAEVAMRMALKQAGLAPSAVDYINLHGTATPQNDLAESLAVYRVFGDSVPCSSTKPLTGHALGAAGAIEAGLCWLALQQEAVTDSLPPHWWDGEADPALAPLALVRPGMRLHRPLQHVLSNSFAFGGNNASLLLSRE